jgi:hypothetical protein
MNYEKKIRKIGAQNPKARSPPNPQEAQHSAAATERKTSSQR